ERLPALNCEKSNISRGPVEKMIAAARKHTL
ncbi:unnamed protein product, partial [marine sediment metagenome]